MVLRAKGIKEKIEERIDRLNVNYTNAYRYYLEEFKNHYPLQTVIGKEKYIYTNETYTLESKDYIFYNFDTWDFGAPVALDKSNYVVVEGIDINYCNFVNCTMHNIIFRKCSFSGSKFKKVNFEQVIFEHCLFTVPVMEKGKCGVDDTYYAPTIFETCIFVCTFSHCDLDICLFEKCNFTLSKINECSMQNSIINTSAISSMEIKDCNLCGFSLYNTDILDITFMDERLTLVNEYTLIDYCLISKKKDTGNRIDSGWRFNVYDEMCLNKAKTIRYFSRLFGSNGLGNYEGELFYRSKIIELRGLHTIDKLKSMLALCICGFGERPSFTFLTIIISTMLFGVLYMFSGIDAAGYYIKYTFGGTTPIWQVISDYGKCLFFSVTTFSTVGYGNYVPIESISMLLSATHMVTGVSLCALWTGCIFRKISR